MVWEGLEGSKRAQEDLGGSRRVLVCLEDLGGSVRVSKVQARHDRSALV